jgi:hypothetical protein
LKNVLDLLEEFCKLNDARTASRGYLTEGSERRWRDLKALYDRLMSRPPAGNPTTNYFAEDDIRERLKHRKRLRVKTDMEAFFRYRDTYLSSRLVNVSRGGLFLSSNVLLSKGSYVTLYLPNLGSDYGELFETKGEVAWTTPGIPEAGIPRGMGIRFKEVTKRTVEQLDSYIIESLQKRLNSRK